MLTGTWLEREKLLAGLFFLLLLLLLLLPPELTVLPPDTFLFRRLFGACLAGSATHSQMDSGCVLTQSFLSLKPIVTDFHMHVLPGGATILCHFWKRQVFRQSLGLKLYVLCLDISSCMGSKITHSFGEDKETRLVHFRLG